MVRSIDIMPTILDFLNISDSPQSQGVSLLPALRGKLEESPILLETMFPYYAAEALDDIPVKITGLRTSEWKIVYVTMEKDGKPAWVGQLYNLKKDRCETKDLADQYPGRVRQLADEWLGYAKRVQLYPFYISE